MRRILILFSLVIAGEMVFSLPFHIARFFRPTFLDVYSLSNAQLGDIFAFYGVVAMLAYFPGGMIADYFSARKLLTLSLVATACGGMYLAQVPDQLGLKFLFAYWGMTSILFFWAALIKATREWGGALAQGKAFGVLEGGRGLVAAGVASVAVLVIKMALPIELDNATDVQRIHAMQQLVYFYVAMTLVAAALVWIIIPDKDFDREHLKNRKSFRLPHLFSQSTIWLQATVLICAYCGYKGLDNYGLYAVDVLGMNELESAQFVTTAAYLRPVAAIAAGLIVDRFFASGVISIIFALLSISYVVLFAFTPTAELIWVTYGNVIVTFAAIFGLRGTYFALLEETKTATNMTGVTVGLVSAVGFLPDVFFAAVTGRILDATPGFAGYQNYFVFLTIFALIGMVAAFAISRKRISTNSNIN